MNPRRSVVLVICLAAAFTTLLDQSSLNTAIPAVHSALGAGPGTLQWIIAGYSLTFGLALIPGGRPGAEAARIDALFVPDLLRFGAQGTIGGQEPLIFVAALSQLTTRIGLIATVSTTFHHPFNLARLFGTLDHVSNGRAAWNLVTSSIGEENREGRTLRELIIAAQDTGHWAIAGTPEQIADAVEERFRAGVLDVLSFGGLADYTQHEFAVDGLLHELRRRGIVKPDYHGTMLRETRSGAPVSLEFLWYIPNQVQSGHRDDDVGEGHNSLDTLTGQARALEENGWAGPLNRWSTRSC